MPVTDDSLWYVTLVFSGDEVEANELRSALYRLTKELSFMTSTRYRTDRVEVSYWDQADCFEDVNAMALRMWPDHRREAGLPEWTLVSLEVLDRQSYHERQENCSSLKLMVPGQVRPWP